MTTYRERRMARAERLTEWADKREERGTAAVEHAHDMASVIPFGQPILVDHYSAGRDRRYRDRIGSTYDRGFADLSKARDMRSRAANIEAQADGAIYSDDPDAIEQLEARIAKLEAEREQIKAHNAAHRNGKGCTCPADCACRSKFRPSSCGCKQHPLPAYVLTNLSGNIKRNRDRLEVLKRQGTEEEHPRWITARFDSTCAECSEPMHKGDLIAYYKGSRRAVCRSCEEG